MTRSAENSLKKEFSFKLFSAPLFYAKRIGTLVKAKNKKKVRSVFMSIVNLLPRIVILHIRSTSKEFASG